MSLVLSLLAHGSIVPLGVPSAFEVHEVEGEAAIPIDLFVQGEPPTPLESNESPLPPAPPDPANAPNPAADPSEKADASARPADDASSLRHDSDAEASTDAENDASLADRASSDANAEAEANTDASTEANTEASPDPDAKRGPADLDGAVARATDAGSTSGAPRDPEAIVGAAGAIQADVVLVMLVLNAEVIRGHPVGARLGYLLRALPQWDDFMSGTDIDPVRDIDWVIISGPSLLSTSRDVVLVHYSAPDALVDRGISVLSRRSNHGGGFDAGVRGVRAVLAHADRADRVILRTQAHVVAVVPPSVAQKIARQLVSAPVPAHVRPGEALYLRLVDPHHPFPEIPESVKEMRLRVVPRDDGGADVYIVGDTDDAATASQAADDMKRVVRRHNDPITSLVTGGLLDHVEVTTEGPRVQLHLVATRAQIERLAELAGGFLGVQPEAPTAPSGAIPGTQNRPEGTRGPPNPR